jgi:hypothetical protein
MGRLGNCCFEVASTIGVARKLGTEYAFNEFYNWPFRSVLPTTKQFPSHRFDEYPNMCYREDVYHQGTNFTIEGYFQSEKYFEHIKLELIQKVFAWPTIFERDLLIKYQLALRLDPTAIHVRLGDYTTNGWYIGDQWYLDRMSETKGLVLVFSDNLHYCENLFKDFPNVLYIYEDSNESLCLMSKCRHHVISNSTFSWWGAWLSQSDDVTYPNWFHEINNGNCTFPNKDFYPTRWKSK